MRSVCPLRRIEYWRNQRWNYWRGYNCAELVYFGLLNFFFECDLSDWKNFDSRSKLIFTDRARGLFPSLSRARRGIFPSLSVAVAVTHPRFLDVSRSKKLVRVLAASGFLDEFSFFSYLFSIDLIGARKKPTLDRANPAFFLSFMQIATATIIDNNCRRSIASPDRIRPFASNKMHDFLSVFERLL